MNKKLLLKLGIPFLALTIIAGCGTDDGTDDEMDPADDEAPLIEDDDGAPMNPDDENGENNGGMNDEGDEDSGNMTDDPQDEDLEEEFDNQNGTGGTGNQ
jgi:hypothetical protein